MDVSSSIPWSILCSVARDVFWWTLLHFLRHFVARLMGSKQTTQLLRRKFTPRRSLPWRRWVRCYLHILGQSQCNVCRYMDMLCMRVYIYNMCIICMYIYIQYVYIYTIIYINMYICIYVYISMYIYICKYIYIYVCTVHIYLNLQASDLPRSNHR